MGYLGLLRLLRCLRLIFWHPNNLKHPKCPNNLINFLMWAGLDLNQRRPKPADLQSAPVDRFGTDPEYDN